MTVEEFRASLRQAEPPSDLPVPPAAGKIRSIHLNDAMDGTRG